MTINSALIFATTQSHLRFPANKKLPAIFLIHKKIRKVILCKVIPELYEWIDPFPGGMTSRTSQPPLKVTRPDAKTCRRLVAYLASMFKNQMFISGNLLSMKGPHVHVPT